MTICSVVFSGLLAMAPTWVIVDIPYPEAGGGAEVSGPGGSGASAEAQITNVLNAYARTKSVEPLRKGDVLVTRIDGSRATGRVNRAGRTETVYLERAGSDWKIVRTE